jgi:hypothetical protein
MPNAIQYTTGSLSGSLQKSTVALGVTSTPIISASVGPTSTTGWYSGIDPVNTGSYVVYKTSPTVIPQIFSITSSNELFNFVTMQGGLASDILSTSASLQWIATQTNLMAANLSYENIITRGLVLHLDAGFVSSFPTTGSKWYGLTGVSGSLNSGSLINGPIFNPTPNNGSFTFDGTDDNVLTSYSIAFKDALTWSSWVYVNDNTSNSYAIMALYTSPTNYNILLPRTDQGGFCLQSDGRALGGSFLKTTPNINFSASVWYHVCLTKGANSNVIIYQNGTQITNASINNSINFPSALLTIGSLNPGNYFKGKIAQVSVYNRQLSSEEVLQNYNAQKDRYIDLLLDLYPNSTAAYSLRKLSRFYTGSAIRVRRLSDNAEQDIGFVDGILDTASLLSFCAATDGFVVKWYSQVGGSTMDVIQTTAIKQPKIVISGVLNTLNGKPSIQYKSADNTALVTASGVTVQSGDFFTYAVALTTTIATNAAIVDQDDQVTLNGRVAQYLWRGGAAIRVLLYDTAGTTVNVSYSSFAANSRKLFSSWKSGTQLSVGLNTASNTQTRIVTQRTTVVKLTIGAGNDGNSDFHDGEIQEAVTFSVSNVTNRTNIFNNINDYYAIY